MNHAHKSPEEEEADRKVNMVEQGEDLKITPVTIEIQIPAGRLKTIVDTRASINLIDENLLQTKGMKQIHEHWNMNMKANLHTATRSKIETKGKVNLPFKIQGRFLQCQMVVVKNLSS